MKKKMILLIVLLGQWPVLYAQTHLHEWVAPLNANSIYAVESDISSNRLLGGVFNSTKDFDPGSGTHNLTSAGGNDGFILKLDADGNFDWVGHISGTDLITVSDVKADDDGNVYVTGSFNGTADLDPTAGELNFISAGSADVFVIKLDSDGDLLWAKAFGGTSNDYPTTLTVDMSGNVLMTGYFLGTADFDPGTGTLNLTSNGGQEIFVVKLNNSGDLVWAQSFGDSSSDQGRTITVDEAGNVYVGGYFNGTVDFNSDPTNTNNITAIFYDGFILKLNPMGDFGWVKAIIGSNIESVQAISFDNSGNIYVTGHFRENPDFDPGDDVFQLVSNGGYDFFVEKLDSQGDFVWARSFGSILDEQPNAMVIDSHGDVIVCGFFKGEMDLDPAGDSWIVDTNGMRDFFIQKLNSSGDFVWAANGGGSSDDYIYDVTIDEYDNIFTVGSYSSGTDFDPGAGTDIPNLSGSFLHKLCYAYEWYADTDGDGYGDAAVAQVSCEQPTDYVLDNTDCDDSNEDEFPGQTWYADTDADGYGDAAVSQVSCTQPNGYVLDDTDCDDSDDAINPEIVWYADTDADGYGDSGVSQMACEQPMGYVLDNTDCDDSDGDEFPGQTWYADTDADGYGDAAVSQVSCTQPNGYVVNHIDCDDSDEDEFPGQTWYADTDADGYGDAAVSQVSCTQPNGYVVNDTDCDDSDDAINPEIVWYADTDADGYGDAEESQVSCEQPAGYVLDNSDCDDTTNELSPETVWYEDADGDGYGNEGVSTQSCTQPEGYSADATDCDDTDAAVNPGAASAPNNCTVLAVKSMNDESRLYPNPTNGEVQFPASIKKDTPVAIYTLKGTKVKEVLVDQSQKIYIHDLPADVYLLRMQGSKKEVQEWVIIKK